MNVEARSRPDRIYEALMLSDTSAKGNITAVSNDHLSLALICETSLSLNNNQFDGLRG